MNALRNAGNWISHKTQGHAHEVSKETNKQIAKDPNVRTSTRLRAAGNAMKDAVNEGTHKRQGTVHREAAKHNY